MVQITTLRIIKIISLLIIFFTAPLFPQSLVLSIIEVFGLFIALWTFWTIKVNKFSLSFSLPKTYRFVAKGIYKYVRFPLITAIILITVPLVISYYSMMRVIVWLTLCAVSIIYVIYKDNLLLKNYNDYSLYKQKTYRIIPFLF